jgi:PASTA domain-containing protein
VKPFIELLTALVLLAAALIGLNKAGVVEVPVVNEVPIFQPDDDFPTPPIKVAVPDVRGLSLQEAQDTLAERGLGVQGIESRPIQLCQYEQGMVEDTLPPAGVEISEGEDVILYVCG